eukprot:TRINITY_DN1219_c0_g3_i1.p1 TRINITY_DN1219_c0_g3~~TRINITY_DN1219_c0_g3_i1.p1  ORF type:complete len:405 (+),score=127.72 TRINITY_DN1219_c0_g3_i1:74-1216(+)
MGPSRSLVAGDAEPDASSSEEPSPPRAGGGGAGRAAAAGDDRRDGPAILTFPTELPEGHHRCQGCGTNSWDNVRVKNRLMVVRCRGCELQMKAPSQQILERRCQEFHQDIDSCNGATCPRFHVHRYKNVAKEKFHQEYLRKHGKAPPGSLIREVGPESHRPVQQQRAQKAPAARGGSRPAAAAALPSFASGPGNTAALAQLCQQAQLAQLAASSVSAMPMPMMGAFFQPALRQPQPAGAAADPAAALLAWFRPQQQQQPVALPPVPSPQLQPDLVAALTALLQGQQPAQAAQVPTAPLQQLALPQQLPPPAQQQPQFPWPQQQQLALPQQQQRQQLAQAMPQQAAPVPQGTDAILAALDRALRQGGAAAEGQPAPRYSPY